MQARMKKHPLSAEQISRLLETEPVGRLATHGRDGYPYITPVHFVSMGGKIFVHGLEAGEKLDNIKNNPLVGFEVEKMLSLLHDATLPCGSNTEYQSVIIRGHASILHSAETKTAALDAIVAKYAPQHRGKAYPPAMLKMTAVIEIAVQACTGKYYS